MTFGRGRIARPWKCPHGVLQGPLQGMDISENIIVVPLSPTALTSPFVSINGSSYEDIVTISPTIISERQNTCLF